MKLLAIERELDNKAGEGLKPLLMGEARRAWELYQSGFIREIYFVKDRPLAVVILEADTVDEAKRSLATLPLVKEGYIDFDLLPLVPYPGFARLFKDQA